MGKKKEDIKKEKIEVTETKEEVEEVIIKKEENKKSKKPLLIVFIIIMGTLILGLSGIIIYNFINGDNDPKPSPKLVELPKPEVDESRGDFGIDKNINEKTIDNYLGRKDTVYRDMRMLEDPAIYENIGGDRFLSGYIEGFEAIPLPYIIPVSGLPEEVGKTYEGITLFYEQDGAYVANYEESMDILEKYFPKDKNIFLMCGGGGYAGMMKNFLISMGWNPDKVYNVGGYWYYEGEHKVDLKRDNGTIDYDRVPYISINFSELTKSANFKDVGIKVDGVKFYIDSITVEEGLSRMLDYYVSPYNASNREVTFKSSNEKIATVSDTGYVKGIKEGVVTITVTTIDQGFSATIPVTVTKRVVNKIKLDDVSESNKEMSKIDLAATWKKYTNIIYDENDNMREQYRNGSQAYLDLLKQRDNEISDSINEESKIVNSLVDDKKTFIVIIKRDSCGDRPYSINDKAPELLDKNNYSYINIKEDYWIDGKGVISYINAELLSGIDEYDYKNNAVIIIYKDGKVMAALNPDKTTIYNEADFITWLSKYIDVE